MDSRGSQKPCTRQEPGTPLLNGPLLAVILGNALTWPQSISSTSFAGGQEHTRSGYRSTAATCYVRGRLGFRKGGRMSAMVIFAGRCPAGKCPPTSRRRQHQHQQPCEDRCHAGGVELGRPAAAAADHPLALPVTGHLPPSHLTPFRGNHRRADVCSLVKVRI